MAGARAAATWTAERLLQKRPSLPANPDIAHAFFRTGLIEARPPPYFRSVTRLKPTSQVELFE
jgi:hypothetical protein